MITLMAQGLALAFTIIAVLLILVTSVVAFVRRLFGIMDVTKESIKSDFSFDGVPEQLKHFMFRGVSSEE